MTEAVPNRTEMDRRARAFGFEVEDAEKEFPVSTSGRKGFGTTE